MELLWNQYFLNQEFISGQRKRRCFKNQKKNYLVVLLKTDCMTKKMSMVQCSIKEETDEAGSHLWWLI